MSLDATCYTNACRMSRPEVPVHATESLGIFPHQAFEVPVMQGGFALSKRFSSPLVSSSRESHNGRKLLLCDPYIFLAPREARRRSVVLAKVV